MKILHVNMNLGRGGAAIACMRLHKALLDSGVESSILTVRTGLNGKNIQTVKLLNQCINRIQNSLSRQFLKTFFKTTNPILHSLNLLSSGCLPLINKSDADVVNLHWINGAMLSIKEIAMIKKTIVWTLHDSWAFCGAEHHPNVLEGDKRFIEGYLFKKTPFYHFELDINRLIWLYKKYCWKDIKIHFVTPSHWLGDMLQNSKLLSHQSYTVIPNPINLKIFKPTNKRASREEFNLPLDKKIILFGAVDSNSNINKGLHLLLKAIDKFALIEDPKKVHLVIFGNNKQVTMSFKCSYTSIGFLDDETSVARLYNAADVFVCPSIIESLGYTCIEAISCGVPVVAFATGGIPDVVKHKKNGYLAESFNTQDFALGMQYVLNYSDSTLSENARKYAIAKFDQETIVRQYILLYKSIIDRL